MDKTNRTGDRRSLWSMSQSGTIIYNHVLDYALISVIMQIIELFFILYAVSNIVVTSI